MANIKVYIATCCPYCHMAKALLESKGVNYEEIDVTRDQTLRTRVRELSGRTTVPQIWIGETHVGGFDDLAALERAGKLDPLLSQ